MIKKVFLALIIIFVIIQFFSIDTQTPEIDVNKDFFQIENINADQERIIRSACYDCHSFETKYPWYAKIQPVAWWLKGHIDEGREHLNFSVWGDYSIDKRNHKLEECSEEIEVRHMPIKAYILAHGDSKMSEEEIQNISALFKSLRR